MSDELTNQIIGAAIEVHIVLGAGLLECIYKDMCREFSIRKIPYQRQVAIDVKYKGEVILGQRLDWLVFGEVIVELKSQSRLPEHATAQLLHT
jgi:GxxExxY protein